MVAMAVTLNDLKVIHWLQAFWNAIRQTFVHHFTRFQMTVCLHGSSALAELLVVTQYLYTQLRNFSATCHTYSPCEWKELKSFLRSQVKGQGLWDSIYGNLVNVMALVIDQILMKLVTNIHCVKGTNWNACHCRRSRSSAICIWKHCEHNISLVGGVTSMKIATNATRKNWNGCQGQRSKVKVISILFLTQLAELFILAGQMLSVCVDVCLFGCELGWNTL